MKTRSYILLLIAISFSCKKSSEKSASQEEIEVMVYATPVNDTTKIAATDTVRIRVK
jgi:hypothetical protein